MVYQVMNFCTLIDAFQTKKIQKSEYLSNQFSIANNLLNSFRNNELQINEVFEIKNS